MAICGLDRTQEEVFKSSQMMENIQSLNNFEFKADGTVTVHKQYNIGTGKVFLEFTYLNMVKIWKTSLQWQG